MQPICSQYAHCALILRLDSIDTTPYNAQQRSQRSRDLVGGALNKCVVHLHLHLHLLICKIKFNIFNGDLFERRQHRRVFCDWL